ncbi:hypothetical protein KUV85_00245 [Nocardioides panacisoli]|uniref:hypothetical protein n=1 Tax=Nocardioides panacisoli TaxID=627624 RepID=UPI001C62A079|nr:hypothetical protein [Nocardioides panacisoli]QYJ04144.1 hypothetical protein KUV85_00245 [Nocardioides panacisoli]
MTPTLRDEAREGTIVTPLLGSRGTPPDFAEAYSRGGTALAGRIDPLEGAVISRGCEDADDEPYLFTELLVTAYAQEGGALVTGFDIVYTAEGDEHVLEVPWEVALCGPSVEADTTPSC